MTFQSTRNEYNDSSFYLEERFLQLYPSHFRRPDKFVQLHLQLRFDAAGQHPFRQRAQLHFSEHRREQQMKTLVEAIFPNHFQCPLIIAAIFDDEFNLIVRLQDFEVRPVVAFDFAAAGAFEINNLDDARIEPGEIEAAAGFDEHGMIGREQAAAQFINFLLQHRLAAGDFDEIAAVAFNLFHDVVEADLFAAVKRVGRVAPNTAQIAAGGANEDAGPADEAGFALDGIEDFSNTHK